MKNKITIKDVARIASLGIHHKVRADALRVALTDTLLAAGMPADTMDEYVDGLKAELFQIELERVENIDPSIAARLDDRGLDE